MSEQELTRSKNKLEFEYTSWQSFVNCSKLCVSHMVFWIRFTLSQLVAKPLISMQSRETSDK